MPVKIIDISAVPGSWDADRCFDEGKKLYEDEKYSDALPLFYSAATRGHRPAQERLFIMFEDGLGVEADEDTAKHWTTEFLKLRSESNKAFEEGLRLSRENKNVEAFAEFKVAAEKYDVKAQYTIAQMYERGVGVDLDAFEAVKWYLKAANQGHADALHNLERAAVQNNLGVWFKERGDLEQAIYWTEKAANQGYAIAQDNLGVWFKERGDLEQAIYWAEKAAEQGQAKAQCNLGVWLKERGAPEDLAQAFFWTERSAEQGDAIAQSNLSAWLSVRGTPEDLAQAIYWAEKAANQGNAAAQNNLGVWLQERGTPEDLMQAIYWTEKAAEQGNANAQYNLGVWLKERGTPEDLAQAIYWTEKAANQGHASAQLNLGVWLVNRGGPEDLAQAFFWTKKAAEQGHAGAQYNLGVMHIKEIGANLDMLEGSYWLIKALRGGNTKAEEALTQIERTSPTAIISAHARIESEATASSVAVSTPGKKSLAIKMSPEAEKEARAKYNIGLPLYIAERYKQAGEYFEEAARLGLPDAQLKLAIMYEKGRGVKEDLKEAAYWYVKSGDYKDFKDKYPHIVNEAERRVKREITAALLPEVSAGAGVGVGAARAGAGAGR